MPKKSHVWNHFTPLTGDNVGKAKCNYCADNKKFDTKSGTTNMWRHLGKQHSIHMVQDNQGGEEGITVQTRASSSSSSSFMDLDPADLGAHHASLGPDMDGPSKHLAQMIALHGYDPSIIDDDYYKRFVESLNPEYRVPKRVQIEAACDHIFQKVSEDIDYYTLEMNDNGHERISFAVVKANIMEREVVYTGYQFIDVEWNLHKVIGDVYLNGPSPYHLGNLTGDIIQICIESHLIEMVRHFSNWMHEILVTDKNVFMMAWGITKDHSILKGYIRQILHPTYAVRRELVCTTFIDLIFHSVAEHLYLQINEEFRKGMHSIEVDLTRQRQEEILSQFGLDLCAYKEAWYSWYCYLVVLGNKDTEENSDLTKLLCNIWGEIYRAIKIISTPKIPTSNLCLEELFNVKKKLEAMASVDCTDHHEVCVVFIESKDATTVLTELIRILDEAIKESYLVWSIPLVLDPRYNLARVKYILKRVFGKAAGSYISKTLEHIKALYSDYVVETTDLDVAILGEELDRYLNLCVVQTNPTEGFDILEWWKVHGSRHYPRVARMARDTLSMPTSSQLSSEQIAYVKSRLRGYSIEYEDEF